MSYTVISSFFASFAEISVFKQKNLYKKRCVLLKDQLSLQKNKMK